MVGNILDQPIRNDTDLLGKEPPAQSPIADHPALVNDATIATKPGDHIRLRGCSSGERWGKRLWAINDWSLLGPETEPLIVSHILIGVNHFKPEPLLGLIWFDMA